MFFSKIYGSWKDVQHDKYNQIFDGITSDLFKGKILDLGSGPGYLEEFLVERKINAEILAVDIDNGGKVDVICDGSILPFKDNSFDGIISIDAVHLIKTSDFSRVLKKGGFVMFTIFFNQGNFPLKKRLIEQKLQGFRIISAKILGGRENEYMVLARK